MASSSSKAAAFDPRIVECSFTLETFKEPFTLNCGHKFEETAAVALLDQDKCCPLCNKKITEIHPDPQFKESIQTILKLQTQVEELQQKLDELKNSKDPQFIDLEKTLTTLKLQIHDLTPEKFKATSDTVANLATQIMNLQSSFQLKENEAKDLQAQLILEQNLKNSALLKSQGVSDAIEVYRDDNTRLKAQLLKAEQENAELKLQIAEFQGRNKRKETDFNSFDQFSNKTTFQPSYTTQKSPRFDEDIFSPESLGFNFGYMPARFSYTEGSWRKKDYNQEEYSLTFESLKQESTIRTFTITFNNLRGLIDLKMTTDNSATAKSLPLGSNNTVKDKYNYLKDHNQFDSDFTELFESIIANNFCTLEQRDTLKAFCAEKTL